MKKKDYKRDSQGKFVKGTPQPYGFREKNKPWNKGRNVQTNTGRTHFKKGNKPWSTGLTKETDERLKNISIINSGKNKKKDKNGREERE